MYNCFTGILNFVFDLTDETNYNTLNQSLKIFRMLYSDKCYTDEYYNEFEKEEYKDNFIVSSLKSISNDDTVWIYGNKADGSEALVELCDILRIEANKDETLSLRDIINNAGIDGIFLHIRFNIETPDSRIVDTVNEVIESWGPHINTKYIGSIENDAIGFNIKCTNPYIEYSVPHHSFCGDWCEKYFEDRKCEFHDLCLEVYNCGVKDGQKLHDDSIS